MNTLEILIPTYGRPESAAEAIESCLINSDQRISVRCNSNGFEPSLEKYRNYDTRLNYSSFDFNRGASINFLYLLQHTQARFCMFLSDEDRIKASEVTKFLDFLDNCQDSIKVISCSVYNLQQKVYYIFPNNKISHIDHDLNSSLALNLIPTYMSGLCFFVSDLMKLNLTNLTNPTMGNAYSHIDIARQLLINGILRFYVSPFVLKGVDIKEGGDGYSHRKNIQLRTDGNFDLNPLVYGPKARARQYFYSDKMLVNYRKNTNFISFFMVKMNTFLFFYHKVLFSDKITVIQKNSSIKNEVKLALKEAKSLHEYSLFSFLSFIFYPLIKIPKKINLIFITIFSRTNRLFQSIYVKIIVKGFLD